MSDTIIKLENISKQYRLGTVGTWWLSSSTSSLYHLSKSHPELTGRENIFLNDAILGMTKNDIRQKFDEIVDFAEVVKSYAKFVNICFPFS